MENLLKHYLKTKELYKQIEKDIKEMQLGEYALVTLDFDNFNYINDLFGYQVGDTLLKKVTEHFDMHLNEGEYFSRIHADYFQIWIKAEKEPIEDRFLKATDIKQEIENILHLSYNLVFSGGILVVKGREEGILALIDKANFARKQAKGNHKSKIIYYNNELEKELAWKKKITLEMETALEEKEFEMYLQPKVVIKTNQLAGAEALVRWNSKKNGMIYPDYFIPIFEQNGFIRKLDFYMLNQACSFLKKCIIKKWPITSISVNFSKVHLENEKFVEEVFQTVDSYGIPSKFIEIELTESIIEDNFKHLISITQHFQELGFRVVLDDFGKAYSSLNYLTGVPLDVIKIDREFLNTSSDSEKGNVMIAKMVEMIKSLRLVPVMEGIETKEQVEFLQKLSCDLGQGYYFARPMKVLEYEKILLQSNVVSNIGEVISKGKEEFFPQEFKMDNWELYVLGKCIDMGLMKGYLDEETSIEYINEKALEYLGYKREEFSTLSSNEIIKCIYQDDIDNVKKNIEQLIESTKTLQFQTRAIRKDGKIIILQGKASSIINEKGRPIGLYAFQDITEELNVKEKLRVSEEWYNFIAEQSKDIIFEWNFKEGNIAFLENYHKIAGSSDQENTIDIQKFIEKRVHIYDIQKVKEWARSLLDKIGYNEIELRICMADNEYSWIKIRCNVIADDSGQAIKSIGVFVNTTKEKEKIEILMKERHLDSLTRIYNKEAMKKICRRIFKRKY